PNCSGRVASGPVKPSASKTNSQGHSFSEPSISLSCGLSPGILTHSTLTVFSPLRFPSLSFTNSLVNILQFLLAPSSCEEVVFRVKGQNGHGWSSVLVADGIGIISKLVTDFAP